MSVHRHRAKQIVGEIFGRVPVEELIGSLSPRPPATDPLPPRLHSGGSPTDGGLAQRREQLGALGIVTDHLAGSLPDPSPADLAGRIENFIGFARIPVGVAGPLRINGTHAHGDFFVPMATTEGALVASYQRGIQVISQAGGATAVCLTESVSRAPYFEFSNLLETGLFVVWVLERFDSLQQVVATTSRHCRLIDLQTTVIGKEVHFHFEFTTGDASGQNMVTFATEAICHELLAGAPVQPLRWYLEGNMSGDKKGTMQAFLYARGKKVVAEVTVPRRVIERFLHTTPEEIIRCWQASLLGGVLTGSIGAQAHAGNALTAIFLACGQDVACVSEASVGLTRMDVMADGSFYASISLPNLIVGTVGGGTDLPTTSEALAMMGCKGEGSARKFAEICAATALAGEISLGAAMATGQFAKAHAELGRTPKRQ
jgi:hydroxymethylglutaryl-CoA reductase (NADPH)